MIPDTHRGWIRLKTAGGEGIAAEGLEGAQRFLQGCGAVGWIGEQSLRTDTRFSAELSPLHRVPRTP